MEVEKKIDESEDFLNKMKESIENDKDIKNYFSAFLSSTKSITDYLLSDYAENFNLDIPLNVRDLRNKFQVKSKKNSNRDAQRFYKWFEKKYEEITKDSIGSLMINRRHINIHRKTTSPSRANYFTLPEVNGKTAYIRIETKNKDASNEIKNQFGNILRDIEKSFSIIPSFNSNTIWVLENTNFELIESCNYYLSFLKKIVADANDQFPFKKN